MAIILRTVKGSELTFAEVDGNFQSLFYSSSFDGTNLVLYTTGSTSQSIDLSTLVVDTGSLMVTGSILNGTLTFTKGDGSTFDLVYNTGSYSGSFEGDGSLLTGIVSSSYAVTSSYAQSGGDVSISSTPADNQLAVWTNSTTIEGDSNLTWTGAKLTVTDGNENTEIRDRYIIVKSDSDDANLYLYGYGSGSNSGEIYLAGSRGTIASPSSSLLGDTIGEIGIFGAVPGFRQGARILFQATENFVDTSNYGTKFVIQTVTNGSTTLTTRYVIGGDGNHTFTGNVTISGDITGSIFTGSFVGDGSGLTGLVSSSYAQTASYVETAQTASYVENAQTASYVETAQTASYVDLVAGPNVTINQVGTSFEISGSASTVDTSSLLTTASAEFADITFTKGDGSTFQIETTPRQVIETVKNLESGTLVKGTPVYASGSTGNAINVYAASSSLSSRMPAAYILNQDLTSGQEGEGLLLGFINGIDTSAFASGDIVYVAADGGYTNVKPTGSNLIQNLGKVTVSAVNGSGVISGAGRANDVPNIQEGYIWIGDSNGVATPSATSSIQNVVSSSYALTASYVENAQTASYVETAQTASYVDASNIDGTVANATSASYAQTASYVETAQTASFVTTAQTASYVETAQTASFVTTAQTASYVETAQTASYVDASNIDGTVANATSASHAQTSSYVDLVAGPNVTINQVGTSFEISGSTGGSSLWTDDGGGKISYSATGASVDIYESSFPNTYGSAVTIGRGFLMVGDGNTIGHSVTTTNVERSVVFGNANILGSEDDAGYNIISGNGNKILSGDYNGTIGQNNIIKGDRNFSTGQTNLIYGNDNISLGTTNTIGTTSANVNKSIAIGEDVFVKSNDQIVIGFGIDTNASYTGAKGIYVGIENTRPNSGWFTDPNINTTANFAIGGRDTMRSDVGIIKAGAGAGMLYLVNYNNTNITEPTVDLAGGVAMWAKDGPTGVAGLTVKDDSGGKSWIGSRIGANQVTPTATIHATGEGSTSATSTFLLENSSGDDLFKVTDDSTNFVEFNDGYFQIAPASTSNTLGTFSNQSVYIGTGITAAGGAGSVTRVYAQGQSHTLAATSNLNDSFILGKSHTVAQGDRSFVIGNSINIGDVDNSFVGGNTINGSTASLTRSFIFNTGTGTTLNDTSTGIILIGSSQFGFDGDNITGIGGDHYSTNASLSGHYAFGNRIRGTVSDQVVLGIAGTGTYLQVASGAANGVHLGVASNRPGFGLIKPFDAALNSASQERTGLAYLGTSLPVALNVTSSGDGVFWMQTASAAPSINVTNAGALYNNSGKPTWWDGTTSYDLTTITGTTAITGSLTISGSPALSITSSENISVAEFQNGAYQSYCVPQVHYASWYYNTTTRPIYEDDYLNFGWAGTDLELTVKQLGSGGERVHITKNIANAYSFLDVTTTTQFDLDPAMSSEESSFFYITCPADNTWPFYKVIVTRCSTDGTDPNMYMLIEKIKKTL